MKKHRVKLFMALGILLVGMIGAAGYLKYRQRPRPLTAVQAFEAGQKNLQEGRLREAYAHLDYAARQKPDDTSYAWAAAQAGLKLGLIKPASDHAREAWNRGLKNKEVFQLLVTSVTGDRAVRLEKGRAWLRELPEGRERKELEGDLLQSAQEFTECLRIWTELFDAEPAPALANKIAMTHVAMGHPERAHEFLKKNREADRIDEEGYGLLATLAAYKDEPEPAAAIFAEGRSRHPAGESLKLTEGVFLIWRDQLAEAATIFDGMKTPSADPATAALHRQARLFLGFIRAAQADARALDVLKSLAAGEGPDLEGERLFYEGLKERSVDTLKKARLLIPSHPACDWALARELARARAWKESSEIYKGMSGLLAGAPALQVELAQTLLHQGKLDDALGVVRRVHSRRYYTKASLTITRDLASRKGLTAEAAEAQSVLERRFGDDPAVGVGGSILSLHAGNLSDAASALDALSLRHPGRDDVELAKLSVLFAKKDYTGVLKAAETSRASPASLAPIQAASLVMLGRNEEAAALYERNLQDSRDPVTVLSYANLLLRLGKLEAAAARYGEVLALQPKNPVAHLGAATLAARRRDWKAVREHAEAANSGSTEVHSQVLLAEAELESGRPDRALTYCNRALGLDPKNERAGYLFGAASLALGRVEEAEATLNRLAGAHPEASHILLALARARMTRGATAEALAVVDGAISRKLPGELSFATLRVVLLSRLGRAQEARNQFAAISAQMTPDRALLCEAWILHQEGRTPEAISRLQGSLQDPVAAMYWAELSLIDGKADGVVEALERHALDVPRWWRLGELARQKGNLAAAVACYRRALRLEPENPQLLNNFAYGSLQLETFDQAEVLAAAKKVSSLMPGNPVVLHTYASALVRCKQERECVELLEKSPAVVKKSAGLLHVQGSAYERLEQWAPALKAYEACLAHPDSAAATTGDLSRKAIQERIDRVRARVEKR
jgi:predicted Zn-dependent protease